MFEGCSRGTSLIEALIALALMGGGVIMESDGMIVGGIGVSGAPSGDEDETCAKAGIEAVTDALNF